GVSYVKNFVKKKEYYDADRIRDGSSAQASLDSLAARGFCRPRKPYEPPADIEDRLRKVIGRVMPEALDKKWSEVKLSGTKKVTLIAECAKELSHAVPNPELKELRSVEHVAKFFRTRVDGISPYERLVHAKPGELPDNLHVIPEGIRFKPFDPESQGPDGLFRGLTAYPGHGTKVVGLRSRKKYGPGFHMDAEWPYEITLGKV
ncbi:hypothetical protein BIW11_13403, partial [Tropilaelaps mercedesae]